MADNYGNINPNEADCSGNFKEAVCIDAQRIYDSCGDKDCLEDLRVYFTECGQSIIDQASNVRMRNVDVIMAYVDLEPVPFQKGFYSVDMTFFFNVCLDVFQAPAAQMCIRDRILSGLEFKVLAFYLSGRTYEEIAEKLEISPKMVDNALQRARKKLKNSVS